MCGDQNQQTAKYIHELCVEFRADLCAGRCPTRYAEFKEIARSHGPHPNHEALALLYADSEELIDEMAHVQILLLTVGTIEKTVLQKLLASQTRRLDSLTSRIAKLLYGHGKAGDGAAEGGSQKVEGGSQKAEG
jgi:hypothetical protein